jgi:hypothetical protein
MMQTCGLIYYLALQKSSAVVTVPFNVPLMPVHSYCVIMCFVNSPRLQVGAGAERTNSMQLTLKYRSAAESWIGKHSGWFGLIPQQEMALPSLPEQTAVHIRL